MPQYLADFRQRGAAVQHLTRQRVSKLMGTPRRGLDASALKRMPNNRSNGNLTHKPANGGSAAQKHASIGTTRPSMEEIRRYCLADIRRKRKCATLTAFPSYAHLSGIPVDVVKLEKGNFT